MTGLTPDPRRDFTRRPRAGRTLTPRGLTAALAIVALAIACARVFGAASPF